MSNNAAYDYIVVGAGSAGAGLRPLGSARQPRLELPGRAADLPQDDREANGDFVRYVGFAD